MVNQLSPVGWALPATTKKSLFYRWCAVPTLWLLGMVQDSHEFRAQQTMKILLPHSPLPTPHSPLPIAPNPQRGPRVPHSPFSRQMSANRFSRDTMFMVDSS